MSKALKKPKKPLDLPIGKSTVSHQKEADLSHLRLPIDTSIFGLKEILTLFDTATKEVQNYLTYECDIMYECRLCRSIFRSLANFILHKRKFCRDRFKSASDEDDPNLMHKNGYTLIQDDLKCSNFIIENDPDIDQEGKSKKSIAPILERLLDKQANVQYVEQIKNQDLSDETDTKIETKNPHDSLLLEKIETSENAVFQSKIWKNMKGFDHTKSEIMEIHNILDSNEAVVGPDGKAITNVKIPEKPTKVTKLICSECDLKFSTKKTLTFHIKYKHNPTKMVYPCPCCKETFANAWCVYRHLYKIHAKTTSQVRKYRTQICNSAICTEQIGTSKRSTVEGIRNCSADNEWLDNMEGDNDLQMCGGCGKRFDRKAALTSHVATCSKRMAVCNSIKENTVAKKREADKEMKNKSLEKQTGASKRKPSVLRKYPIKEKSETIESSPNLSDEESHEKNEEESLEKIEEISPEKIEEISPEKIEEKSPEKTEEKSPEKIEEKSPEKIEEKSPEKIIKSPEKNEESPEKIIKSPAKIEESLEKIIESLENIEDNEHEIFVEKNDQDSESDYEEMENMENLDRLSVLNIIGVSPIIGNISSTSSGNENKSFSSESVESEIPNDKKISSKIDNELKTVQINSAKYESNTKECIDLVEPVNAILEATNATKNSAHIESDTETSLIAEQSTEITRGFSQDDLHNSRKATIENTLRQLARSKRKRSKSCSKLSSKIRKSDISISEDESFLIKIKPYIDENNLACLPCDKTFNTLRHLLWHMAEHFSWYKYQCCKCHFMSCNKYDCELHAHKEHDIPFNALVTTVLPIPSWKTVLLSSEFHPITNGLFDEQNMEDNEESNVNEIHYVDLTANLNDENDDIMEIESPIISNMELDIVPENSSRPVRKRVKSFKAIRQDFEYDLKNIFRQRPPNKTV